MTVSVVALVTFAAPASAHAGEKLRPGNYKTTLDSFGPAVDGVSLKLVESGTRVALRNERDQEVVVDGYEDEPYLRVGKDGVFVNVKSPAYYLNQTFKGNSEVPPEAVAAQAKATPDWKKLSDGNVAYWHDHRIHWMGGADPPVVTNAPNKTHVLIPHWEIKIRTGDQVLAATGSLAWVPGPSPWPWYVVSVVLLIGALGAAHVWRERAVAIAMPAVLVAYAVQTLGASLENAGPFFTRFGLGFESLMPMLIASIVGGYGSVRLWRRQLDGPWFCIFSAVLAFLFGGINQIATFDASQVPSAVGAITARASAGVDCGLGGAASLACLLLIREQRKEFAESQQPGDGLPQEEARQVESEN